MIQNHNNKVIHVDPLVSICIPAYNAERFISQTVESALAQDYPNLEIIVSDDCSIDRTQIILQVYNTKGVRLIKQNQNLGMHGNWNAVIRSSHGKYIVKLDADDLLAPQYVSNMVSIMEAYPEVTFSHCGCRLIDAEGRFLGYERSIRGSFIGKGFKEWPRYVLGSRAVNIVMLRRSAFDSVGGYDERFRYSGDWKMHRDLLQLGDVFYNDQILASYRSHSVNKTGVRLLQAKEHLMHLEDMAQNWPPSVPGKDRLLAQAQRIFAMGLAKSMASVSYQEAEEIFKYLPGYGNFLGPRILADLIRKGGGKQVRRYLFIKEKLRQFVKNCLYKKTDNAIAALGRFSNQLSGE